MFPSKLRPDSAIMVGVLTSVGVYLIYNNALPNLTDIRSAPPNDSDVESERKAAAWKSAALLGVVFLVSHDLNSYIISGVALAGIDYMHKHANGIHPATGKLDNGGGGETVAPGMAGAYSLPDYQADDNDTDVTY